MLKEVLSMNLLAVALAASMLFSVAAASENLEGRDFDDTKVNTGTVGARYIPAAEKRIKTRVQKDDGKYDYDLFGRDKFEYFPLQLGNGQYKVTIFENVVDTKYRVVKSQDVKSEIKDPLGVYLASIQTVNWTPEMAAVKKAAELTKGLKTEKEKIEVIYKYVVDTFSYDYEKIKTLQSTYVPDIEQIMKDKKGICYDYSAVLAAMLRSQNIPTKLIKGYSSNVTEYHAWNEVYLSAEKRWMVVDTTYDSVLKKKGKKTTMEKQASKYKMSREF